MSQVFPSVVLDEYRINFMPAAVGMSKVFARRESRVFWLVVRSTHRVSSQFAEDCRKIGKALRHEKPKDVKAFELLLLKNALDPAAQCPFRPTKEKMQILVGNKEVSDELQAKLTEEALNKYYANLEELRQACMGIRKPEVKFKIEMRVEDAK